MREPKVSVIIPFYRAEKFLGACLDSLLAQSYTNLEILCIGENVEDASHAIAQQYADDQPSRIRFLLQPLEGEPRAQGPEKGRNIGMDVCTGDYISFMDADDTVHQEYIHTLYDVLLRHNADVSCCGFERINGSTGQVLSCEAPAAHEECLTLTERNFCRMAFVYPAPWGKLYKRDCIGSVRSYEGIPSVCGDLTFFLAVLPRVRRFAMTPDCLYKYIMYDSGLIMSFTPEKFYYSLNAIQVTCASLHANPPGHAAMLTLSAFIHIGIAMVHRATQNNCMSYAKSIAYSRSFLDAHFPDWRRIGPLPDGRPTIRGLAVYVMKLLYIYGGAETFMRCYNAAIRLTGRELKW